jgi:hypothetical protein
MARPGLTRHRKFARLSRLIGSEVLARGHLEFMWDVAYENGDDLLGDAGDLEHLARWEGTAGALAAAMVEAGFVDETPEGFRVHDLWHHAPQYVTKRAAREAERTEKGDTLSAIRSQAGRKGAERRWQTDGKRNPLATQQDGNGMANGLPPAPAPAPIKTLSSDSDETEVVVERWNSICLPVGFAKARGTKAQRATIRTRLREPSWLETFTAACQYMAGNPFYRGASSSGWVADFGWILKPGNAEKTADKAATRIASSGAQNGQDAAMRAAVEAAARYTATGELAAGDAGDGRGVLCVGPQPPLANGMASDGSPLSAAAHALLGGRGAAGLVQDAIGLEPRARNGAASTAGAVRDPRADAGRDRAPGSRPLFPHDA